MNRPVSSIASLAAVLLLLIAHPAAADFTDEECESDSFFITLLEGVPNPDATVTFVLSFLQERFATECVDLNEIQVLGTHNSYHLQPSPALFNLLHSITPAVEAWEYSHLPLVSQAAVQGVRQFELDVFPDPAGGEYFLRLGPLLVGEPILGPLDLVLPGFKVLHVPHLDFESSCLSLAACLAQLKAWSDASPGHLPVMVLVEIKSGTFGEEDAVLADLGLESAATAAPLTSIEYDALDSEFRAVFSEDRLFTPDDLRGARATLEEAVLTDGWPTLGELRGQILFAMDNAGDERLNYLAGHPALAGRVMFTNSTPGQADAAFVKVNDPLSDPAQIPSLVAQGYLVRTRADTDTVQARTGDTTRRDAALASGAQFVSTDFPFPSGQPGFSNYFVQIPGGSPARCNPIAAPIGCRSGALEVAP